MIFGHKIGQLLIIIISRKFGHKIWSTLPRNVLLEF